LDVNQGSLDFAPTYRMNKDRPGYSNKRAQVGINPTMASFNQVHFLFFSPLHTPIAFFGNPYQEQRILRTSLQMDVPICLEGLIELIGLFQLDFTGDSLLCLTVSISRATSRLQICDDCDT
jgi:hypothetical protein